MAGGTARIACCSDSDLGLPAGGHDAGPEGAADLRAGFAWAVRAAIATGADAFLHAGGLLHPGCSGLGHDEAVWLERCWSRLDAAGTIPIVHETGPPLERAGCEILPLGGAITRCGVRLSSGLSASHGDAGLPQVRCLEGALDGAAGIRPEVRDAPIDAARLVREAAGFCVLAGSRYRQLVQPNAAYTGPTAPLDRFCRRTPGVLLLDVGLATGQVLTHTVVRLPARRIVEVRVDASGLPTRVLGQVLHDRIDARLRDAARARTAICDRIRDSLHDATTQQVVNELYGRDAADPAEPWLPDAPVVDVTVSNALCTLEDAWAADGRLAWFFGEGRAARIHVTWDGTRTWLTPG